MKQAFVKWEKCSRIFEQQENDGTPTGRMVEEAVAGEQCCYHDGEWKPYVWLPAENKLKFRDNEYLEFQSGQQRIIKGAKTVVESSKFFVQRKVGENWVNQPHGLPTRNLEHDFPKPGQCTAYLDFPDAQYDLQIGLRIGLARKTRLGFRFRAPISGEVRFQWVLDGIEKLPTDYEWIYTGGGFKGNPEKKTGIRLKNISFGWSYAEADERDISVETNPDETKKITITFGPYEYEQNSWLNIIPEVWGLTETSDDCYEEDGDYYDNYGPGGYLLVGDYDAVMHIGWIWDNVTATGTADDGCYIKVYDAGNGGDPAQANLKIQDTGAPLAWGADHVPSDCTFEQDGGSDVLVAWNNMGDASPDDSPEIKTLIQARFDGGHSSGDKMSVCFMDNSSPVHDYSYCKSEETGTGAKLKIVYTAAAGAEGSRIARATAYYNMRRGISAG